MVCLWAGGHSWKTPRRRFKEVLGDAARTKGLELAKRRQDRWDQPSATAAAGLGVLSWNRIGRVLGLNPWGEQLLLKLKHHAISTYNPIAAGHTCPHEDCLRTGQVDLHHIFWTCPAARLLRDIFVARWHAAGLKLTNWEEAMFALKLPEIPRGLAIATGAIVAVLPESTVESIGNLIEQTIAGCWSLGAALYFHAVWRWRVAHFDPHNDTSTVYHIAGYKSRLRTGHLDITHDYRERIPQPVQDQFSRCICTMLGGDWGYHDGVPQQPRYCYLVLFAGAAASSSKNGSGGTLIVKIRLATGIYVVQYVSSALYMGDQMTPLRAAQLGLLRGLRRCLAYHWRPVHVMGDHAGVMRQQLTRTPPRAKRLKGTYWKIRRMANAVAAVTWTTCLREHNRTAHGLANMAAATGKDMEWNANKLPDAGGSWPGITAHIRSDVAQWLQGHAKSVTSVTVANKV